MKKPKMARMIVFTLLLVALACIVGTQLIRAVSWGSDTQLTDDLAWELTPSLMQARDGTIWVAFASDRKGAQFDLYCKTYDGVSWSNDTRLTWDPSKDDTPSIMQTHNETIWLVWASDRTGNAEIFYQTRPMGKSWGSPVQLTTDLRADTNPSVMQNLNGTIWIVWHREMAFGNFDIVCKTSSDFGLNWSDELYITEDPGYEIGPSITHIENGTVFVAWSSYIAAEFQFDLYYKTYNGSFWFSEVQLTTDPGWDTNPSIMQDANGTMWVFWESDRGGNNEIYYKTSSNYGASWSLEETKVVSATGDDQHASVDFGNDRKVWLAFESGRTDDFEIWYKTSDAIPDVHDIAITSVVPWTSRGNDPATWCPKGMPIYVNVTVENQGSFNETFDVLVYADRDVGDVHVEIANENVFFTHGTKETLVFTWNTNTTDCGNYCLSAELTILPLEIDIADNTLLKAAKIGGIAVPWLGPEINIFTLLGSPLLATLVIITLGMFAVAFFKLLMSIRPRLIKRRSIEVETFIHQKEHSFHDVRRILDPSGK